MLPRLRAEEQLAAVSAANAPHAEREEARDYMRSLENVAGAGAAPRKATLADIASLGIGIVTEGT